MAAVEAVWGPTALRFLRVAVANTTKVVRTKLSSTSRAVHGSAGVRTGHTGRQPIHPSALLRQQKRPARWFSGPSAKNVEQAVRRFIAKATSEGSAARSSRFDRSNSHIARQMAQGAGRAPFSSTLRPNLTGGALPRSAGGYGIGGGGARYFSHGPAAPAQVVQNVSQAMRAFFLSGQKLRYDGVNQNGERQYRAVSSLEDKAMAKFQAVSHRTPGAFIDFHLQPTVTSVGPLAAAVAHTLQSTYGEEKTASDVTLNADGFLGELSADFERTLKDLNATYADIQRLAILGDLPIMLQKGNTLRVTFPGMDAYALENLCDDIGITRGVIGQDEELLSDESADPAMTLQFPFAPDSDKTITSPGGSERSIASHEAFDEVSSLSSDDSFVRDALMDEMADNPWMSENDRGYESSVHSKQTKASQSEDFEGLEGIYRFLEECDRAQTKF